MKYSYNRIVSFLTKQGWTNKGENQRFSYFEPPLEMGFPPDYLLPVPRLFSAPDYNESLVHIASVIAQFYDSSPELLFFDVGDHLSLLRQKAIYLKMSSNEPRQDHSLDFSLIGKFIDNITKSYQSFFKVRFKQLFAEKYRHNLTRVNKTATRLLDVSSLRLVDLEFKSFSFGVSVDTMMGREIIDYRDIKTWREEVLPEYKKKVLQADFYSREGIELIKDKFTAQERKLIYEPIFKSINEDITLSITSSDYVTDAETIRRIPKETQLEIVPPIEKEEDEKRTHFYQMIVAVDESGNKRTMITPKKLEASLFAREVENFEISELKGQDKQLVFSEPIEVNFESEGSQVILRVDKLNLEVESDSFDRAQSDLQNAIWKLYYQWVNDDSLFALRSDSDDIASFFKEKSSLID